MERKTIALQLIKEDLRYHQFAAYLKKADLHLEYFPDLAPIVIQLIRPEIDEQTSESLLARYVKMVSLAKVFENASGNCFQKPAEIIFQRLLKANV